jgi:hypothetical protein
MKKVEFHVEYWDKGGKFFDPQWVAGKAMPEAEVQTEINCLRRLGFGPFRIVRRTVEVLTIEEFQADCAVCHTPANSAVAEDEPRVCAAEIDGFAGDDGRLHYTWKEFLG